LASLRRTRLPHTFFKLILNAIIDSADIALKLGMAQKNLHSPSALSGSTQGNQKTF